VLLRGVLLLNFFSKFFKDPKQYRGDYGDLFVPPSKEAEAIIRSMNREEQANFKDLLGRLQQWHESAVDNASLKFHPEARALLWGAALAKIADHYLEMEQYDRGLFFANAAWILSKYPVFAFNAGILSIEIGDTDRGRRFLRTYLDEYSNILTTRIFELVAPEVTSDELERLAETARYKLAALQEK